MNFRMRVSKSFYAYSYFFKETLLLPCEQIYYDIRLFKSFPFYIKENGSSI